MRVGILGAGQLARMLAIASKPLAIETLCLSNEMTRTIEDVSAVFLAQEFTPSVLKEFAKNVDIITYETENVDSALLDILKEFVALTPSEEILKTAQDRLLEKNLFKSLSIPTPKFAAVDSLDALKQAVSDIGLPAVLKTRRMGYDGKGQHVIRSEAQAEKAFVALGEKNLILEQFIPYDRELSLVAVRTSEQQIQFYDLAENLHLDGILRLTFLPVRDLQLQQKAEKLVSKLLHHLNYVGVCALELFEYQGELLANEMAPRVHNTGHWTIEGAVTSQFENHLRALCHLPIGNTETRGFNAMFNCIGEMPVHETILSFPNTHYHSYQKEARAGRKVGHVTLSCDDELQFQTIFKELKKVFKL